MTAALPTPQAAARAAANGRAAGDRVVCHLRLRAPSASAAWQLRQTLDDALRCASLPDAGERLLLVRRLDLGPLPAGLSAARLAAHIEQAVASAGQHWVHGDDPAAGQASAVWFASPLQAACSQALGLARGLPLDAWYWPLALPALAGLPRPAVADRLAALLDTLGYGPAGAVRLAAWWQAVASAGQGAWLLAQLPGPQRALLGQAAGLTGRSATQRPVPRAGADGVDSGPPGAGPAVSWPSSSRARRPATGGTTDDGADLSAAAPVPDSSQGRPSRSSVVLGEAAGAPPVDGDAMSAPADRAPAPAGRAGMAPGPAGAAPRPPDRPAEPVRPPAAAQLPKSGANAAAPADASAWPQPGQPTDWAGLVMLLPLLDRLGIAAHADARALALQVLHQALQRLAVPEDDAIHAWLRALADGGQRRVAGPPEPSGPGQPIWADLGQPGNAAGSAESAGSRPSAGLADAVDPAGPADSADPADPVDPADAGDSAYSADTGDPAQPAAPADSADPAIPARPPTALADQATTWLRQARRHLRLQAGIGLASLARRPGWLDWGPTHLDTSLPLQQADIRIRRAGLDIDPGWLPWLQRVLRFHYPRLAPPAGGPGRLSTAHRPSPR